MRVRLLEAPDIVVCPRVGSKEHEDVAVGSETRSCKSCGAFVWMGPETIRAIREHNWKMPDILCAACALQAIKGT